MSPPSELEVEQAVLDDAHARLAAMRAKAERLLAEARASGGLDPDLEQALIRRVGLLADGKRPLCFGRTDEADGGVTWHIGRRHVEDAAGDPVVVEWRTPVAAPFYQARAADPMGLRRRRTLLVDGRRVVSISDDLFDEAGAVIPQLRGGEALLAELDRARTGEMLDIVATIQAEQDEVIRAPLEGVLAVQGGPGTGKTAIGLHRAAYLLYNHPDLARSGVLVVGPSHTFLRYIAQVLPSLGEEAVTQVTLADLVPKVRVRAEDSREVERLKGDLRMGTLLARALAARRREPEEDVVLAVGLSRVRIAARDIAVVVATLAARDGPYAAGRAALRDRLVALARQAWRRLPGNLAAAEPEGELRSAPELRAALDASWPPVSAPALVNELLSSPDRLRAAGEDLFTPEELGLLARRAGPSLGRAPWTAADLPLVDEARALIEGGGRTYGHAVVDEAQDLSPMALRMLARRAPGGSVTVLGDLAQATGPWSHASWEEIVAHLPQPDGWRQAELTLGYRTPGQILDLASRLLPRAAPGVRPTSSVRPGRRPPAVTAVASDQLFLTGAVEAQALADEGFLVGCIVARDHLDAATATFRGRRIEFGTAERDGLTRRITVLTAQAAKGLEFDAVVVVEPAAIAATVGALPAGLRLLFVALTRPLQHLSVVHAEPLPGGLAGVPPMLAPFGRR